MNGKATTVEPLEIIEKSSIFEHSHPEHIVHEIVQRFGSPQQPLCIDIGIVQLGRIGYRNPLIMPIYNPRLELIQCAVLQNNLPLQIIPNGFAKGFAYFGQPKKDRPLIITYGLESFFKIAQTGYAVVLVMLPSLSKEILRTATKSDIKQIQFIIEQLKDAGYQHLYLPIREANSELVDTLTETGIHFIEQFTAENSIDLSQYENTADIKLFLDEAIEQIQQHHAAADTLKAEITGQLAKPFKLDGNSFIHVLKDGLYLVKETLGEDGETKQTKTFLCHTVTVLGEARSLNNDNWKRVLQFHDKDNVQHTAFIPYEHFMGEAQEAVRLFCINGFTPPRQSYKKNAFIQYIQDYPTDKRFRCVDRTGWHGDSFALPNQTYNSHSNDEELIYQYDGISPYKTHGTFEGWQQLSRLIEPHALAVLAFSCAFTGQLVSLLGVESGGFHIHGSSTDGKSTITKAACSVWGNPKDVSKQWRTTDNALENEAELRNDNFLNLDELRQAMPKAVSDVIYMLTGGEGKARSTRTGKNRTNKQFNLMYISNGEVTLEEHLRRGGIELDAGLLLRFAHLPSDAGKGLGVFESLNYGAKGADLGNHINELASKHYGHAGQKWLEYLTQDKETALNIAQAAFNEFLQMHPNVKNPQASRVLRRFALVAAAGELATFAEITGWETYRTMNALSQCFNTWLNNYGSGGNLEERKILEHIHSFFEAHGTSRFENLTVLRHPDGEVIQPRIHNRVGYYDPETKTYLVSPTMFKKEMCMGINEANAKKILKEKGWIECEDGRYTKKMGSCLPSSNNRPYMMHFKIDAIHLD